MNYSTENCFPLDHFDQPDILFESWRGQPQNLLLIDWEFFESRIQQKILACSALQYGNLG